MLKTLLAAAAALTLVSGAGFAQSYSTSTTQSTQTVAPPHHDVDVTTTERHTSDQNGVMIEKETHGTDVTRPADVIEHTKSETTTVR
jgi:hypothetical protein